MQNNESWGYLFKRMAVNDDEKALEQLFMEFYPALCIFAKQYIASEETCKDIVQDTFFKIWQKRKQIDLKHSLRSFLTTSVRNSCFDFIRKKKLGDTFNTNQTKIPLSFSPEEIFTLSELTQLINTSMQQLPENVRYAFELSRFHEKTYAEIAAEMGVSVKTIESYISRALKILREDLKEYLPVLLFFFSDFFS